MGKLESNGVESIFVMQLLCYSENNFSHLQQGGIKNIREVEQSDMGLGKEVDIIIFHPYRYKVVEKKMYPDVEQIKIDSLQQQKMRRMNDVH